MTQTGGRVMTGRKMPRLSFREQVAANDHVNGETHGQDVGEAREHHGAAQQLLPSSQVRRPNALRSNEMRSHRASHDSRFPMLSRRCCRLPPQERFLRSSRNTQASPSRCCRWQWHARPPASSRCTGGPVLSHRAGTIQSTERNAGPLAIQTARSGGEGKTEYEIVSTRPIRIATRQMSVAPRGARRSRIRNAIAIHRRT